MAEPLKNIYNKAFISKFASVFELLVLDLNADTFVNRVIDKNWENLELKERMRKITKCIHSSLGEDTEVNIKTILQLTELLQENGFQPDMLEFIFLPDYIETYGLNHYSTSIDALKTLTQFITCEFAIRPFILKFPDETLKHMLKWSKHKHPGVRRLASEGSRPSLPWALGVPILKQQPDRIIPILENLKNDDSETVRRSVANNLNDISKSHPEMVINIARKWMNDSPERKKLIKHACRTLLKQGNDQILELFGFNKLNEITVKQFEINNAQVSIGEHLEFSFDISNESKNSTMIRLEYGIYYLKANGTHYRKVFKISEKDYPSSSLTSVTKKHSFRVITTRRYYSGKHYLSLILNGKEFEKQEFYLK